MSEEKMEMPVEEGSEAPAEEPVESAEAKANIGDELQELGRHLTSATRAVLESPEAKEIGSQLHRGLESLEKTVSQLVSQARETKVGQTVETSVTDAAATVKKRGVLETASESVTAALRSVNQALGQAVEKAQTRAEEAKAKKSTPQQIEIVDEAEEEE